MGLHMRDTNFEFLRIGDLDEIAIFGKTPALNFILELLYYFIVGVEFIHVVVGEGQFRLKVAVVVKHASLIIKISIFQFIGLLKQMLSTRAYQ